MLQVPWGIVLHSSLMYFLQYPPCFFWSYLSDHNVYLTLLLWYLPGPYCHDVYLTLLLWYLPGPYCHDVYLTLLLWNLPGPCCPNVLSDPFAVISSRFVLPQHLSDPFTVISARSLLPLYLSDPFTVIFSRSLLPLYLSDTFAVISARSLLPRCLSDPFSVISASPYCHDVYLTLLLWYLPVPIATMFIWPFCCDICQVSIATMFIWPFCCDICQIPIAYYLSDPFAVISVISVFRAERSWVQIPAKYSGWPGHNNNVGCSARLEINFELNLLQRVNNVTLLYFFLFLLWYLLCVFCCDACLVLVAHHAACHDCFAVISTKSICLWYLLNDCCNVSIVGL